MVEASDGKPVPCGARVCGMHPAHRYERDGKQVLCPGSEPQ